MVDNGINRGIGMSRSPADDSHTVATNSNSMEKTFILPDIIQFGYHSLHSRQMSVSGDGLRATKIDPVSHYAHGVCYGDKPLRGMTEFEVKITSYGTGWSGTMKLGIMRCKAGSQVEVNTIPRYSPEGQHHCVWSSNKLHNRLSDVTENEKPYGKVNLDDLSQDYRVGLQLTPDGVLSFFVNGKNQGRAAENIYQKGYDVYIVVDHYANCKATCITRAGETYSNSL